MEHMSSKFEISLVDELTYFLGLQFKQTSNGTFISQTKYAKNLFGLEFVIHHRTPVGTHTKISQDKSDKNVDQTLYRSMISSLLYLVASRPNLCYVVGMCAHYQACLKESHLIAIKKIIKYVSGTTEFKLWHYHDSTTTLIGYCDCNTPSPVFDKQGDATYNRDLLT